MTFDRRNKRTSRETKLNVESLGDRIAPAVYTHGLVSLNLVVENQGSNHHQANRRHHHEKIGHGNHFASSRNVVLLPMDKPTIAMTNLPQNTGTMGSNNPVYLPMDKPTIVATGSTQNTGTVGSNNPVLLPMDKPTIVTTGSTQNTGTVGSNNPVLLPMDKPTIVTTGSTQNTGTVVPSEKISLPMDRPPIDTTTTSPVSTLPGNLPNTLVTIYNQYEKDPSAYTETTSTANGANLVLTQGDQVGVQIHDSNADEFDDLLAELTNDGMKFSTTSATFGEIDGLLPIADLVTVAQFSQSVSISPEMASPSTK